MRTGGMSNGNIARRLRANRRDYLAMKKNHIPFALLVSILKPLRKLRQYIVPESFTPAPERNDLERIGSHGKFSCLILLFIVY
jgi:hypothetical protein